MTTAKRLTARLGLAAMLGTMFILNVSSVLEEITNGMLGGGLPIG